MYTIGSTSFLLLSTSTGKKWITIFFFIILMTFILIIFLFKIFHINYMSLSFLFVVLIFLFHFGQVISFVLTNGDAQVMKENFFFILDFNILTKAYLFSYISMNLIVFGILLGSVFLNEKIKENFRKKDNFLILKKVSLAFIILGLPVQVYIDYTKYKSAVTGNYLDVFNNQVNGYVSELGLLFFAGTAGLILYYSCYNKRKSSFILISVVLYLILSMASGGRGKQVIYILLYMYIYNNSIRKINWKNIVLYSLLGIIFFNFLVSIASFRLETTKNISLFIQIYMQSFKQNPIIGLVNEMGGTIQTVYQAISQIDDSSKMGWGSTYINSVFSVFPNKGLFMESMIESLHYVKQLKGAALGGSIIGEVYYNFRYFGLFICPIIGFFIQYVSTYFTNCLSSKSYLKFVVIVPLFVNFLWWTRDAFYGLVRSFLITLLLASILLKIFKKIKFRSII
ncbi:O-antigen polysaccharide polymerase Wzy [Vagococcus penaei]|uniref:O-antigen polysaccharide polymerase Wzy n=1 Tax=Vagococcus penaei TaxID=633807 RepID=UPI0009852EE4